MERKTMLLETLRKIITITCSIIVIKNKINIKLVVKQNAINKILTNTHKRST